MSNFSEIGADVGKLVHDKQLAYGDSFGRSGECLRQMFPRGHPGPISTTIYLLLLGFSINFLGLANDPCCF